MNYAEFLGILNMDNIAPANITLLETKKQSIYIISLDIHPSICYLALMKIKVKGIKQPVDVSDKDCPKRSCFWPRSDPGTFTQGVGYKTRTDAYGKIGWLCGNREIRGCPNPKPTPQENKENK